MPDYSSYLATAHGVVGVMVVLMLIGLCLLPTLIAVGRRHHNAVAIVVLNLLAGWTVIGWVVALVWACTSRDLPHEAAPWKP